jgi:trehalose monomycolate/heme transporter
VFGWWGRAVVRARWAVLLGAAVLVAIGATWGAGIFGTLSGGGYDDPASQSSHARAHITEVFGPQGDDVLVLYASPTSTVDDPALKDGVTAVLGRLDGRPEVSQVMSYYTTQLPSYVSTDRHATYVGLRLRQGDENVKLADLAAIRPLLDGGSGVETIVGGNISFLDDANSQIEQDIVRAELLSLPILLVLLLFIFRGLVAAVTPLVVGVVAILGAFTVTRIVSQFTEVSVFAANVITLLGLGMAIDYALFVVSRFREELAAGHPTPVAIAHTMRTAGRTVVVSGLTVALALSSLLLFPMDFLKSMGYGGMAAVLVAMLAALTALPALLAVLGPRINALRVPLPRWRRSASDTNRWERLARSVMRRPVVYLIVTAAILLGLATPFLRADVGGFDERVLPAGTPSRTVAERIADDFPGGSVAPIVAVVDGISPARLPAYLSQLKALPGVTGASPYAAKGDTALIAITYPGEASGPAARDVVREVRGLAPPPGAEVLVGGRPSADLDQIDGLLGQLGWMALYVGLVTFVLLFFAFGSVVLPLKAIVMNMISIGASFGVVVWIFQDGHLAGFLGFTPTGFLEPTNLILMLAILFGLSTDYEVFLLSRVREEWDRRRSGSSPDRERSERLRGVNDNTEAVATGLQRTGGIITAAALLLIVVVSGFATGGVATIKMLGVGTVVAVALDAALVRTLLVPATMRLIGRWNWWSPAPLARLYGRFGLRESEVPAKEPDKVAV